MLKQSLWDNDNTKCVIKVIYKNKELNKYVYMYHNSLDILVSAVPCIFTQTEANKIISKITSNYKKYKTVFNRIGVRDIPQFKKEVI